MKKNLIAAGWIILSLVALISFSCKKDDWKNSPAIEKEFLLTAFNKISAGDFFTITITRAESFSIVAKGPQNDINDMSVTVDNGTLQIKYDHYVRNRPKIVIAITLPDLLTINLSGASSGIISGFEGANHVIRAVLSGATDATMTGTGINMNVELSGGSQFTVTGATENLYGNISGGSKLKAYGLPATEVDIDVSGGATAQVSPLDKFFAAASGGARIYYKGNPALKQFDISGGGQVIQE